MGTGGLGNGELVEDDFSNVARATPTPIPIPIPSIQTRMQATLYLPAARLLTMRKGPMGMCALSRDGMDGKLEMELEMELDLELDLDLDWTGAGNRKERDEKMDWLINLLFASWRMIHVSSSECVRVKYCNRTIH